MTEQIIQEQIAILKKAAEKASKTKKSARAFLDAAGINAKEKATDKINKAKK